MKNERRLPSTSILKFRATVTEMAVACSDISVNPWRFLSHENRY